MKWLWKKRQPVQPSTLCDDAKCEELQQMREQEDRERKINRRIEALERYAQALKERENGPC